MSGQSALVKHRVVWLTLLPVLASGYFTYSLVSVSRDWGWYWEDQKAIALYFCGLLYAGLLLVLSVNIYIAQGLKSTNTNCGAVYWILLIALVARITVVFAGPPVLSDDIWRYIHDGAMLGQGNNPYLFAPDDLSLDQQPFPHIAGRINNPELVTIYQPTSQYIFASLDWVWGQYSFSVKRWDPNHDKIFRLGFVLFDMLLIAVILAWLRDMGRSAWWAVAYAWHPLTISEVAGSGHQDVIGVAFLVTALWLASRLVKVDRGRSLSRKRLAVAAGIAFGLAIAVKPIVLPIAFALAWMLRLRPGLIAWAASATVITLITLYLPFALMDGGLARMLDTGRTFVDKWAFNGSLYPIFESYIAGKPWVDYAALATMSIVLIVFTLRETTNPARPAAAFLFASLLVSSTVHPWYLLWVLALMPICFSPAFWVFSLTVAASYAAHLHEGYRVPSWVVMCEYLPVYAVLGWGVVNGLRGDRSFSGRSQIAGSFQE